MDIKTLAAKPLHQWLAVMAVFTAIIGPSLIGVASLIVSPALAASAAVLAYRSHDRKATVGMMILFVLTVVFTIILWLGMHPVGLSVMSVQGS